MRKLESSLRKTLAKSFPSVTIRRNIDMPNLFVGPEMLSDLMLYLFQDDQIQAHCLLDICVVDLLHYGCDEWVGHSATSTGFERARREIEVSTLDNLEKNRFVVVYHVQSMAYMHRFRVKVMLDTISSLVPSVTSIWPNANWYEREAFDLYGVRFSGHPNLQRILTDYGFVGYPMRKDFPLKGQVEMRYDAALEQCVYDPVDLEDRVSVPKVIRSDNADATEKRFFWDG